MIKKYNEGFYYSNGAVIAAAKQTGDCAEKRAAGRDKTIAWNILEKHNSGTDNNLKIKFDALASHDITYVGIIQTARASGLEKFPVPYVLTNCHNSLCAVGGTINEDDHLFGLSAAEKYGGIYVPAHQAVIHQYMREMMAGCGKMILGSDSHTRYGAIGTMGIGEGGPELVKQLLCRTYDVPRPEVTAVYLTGSVRDGVGPQDVALAIIREVFADGFVKNKVMEFVGPGVAALSMDFRNGIDVMTTETTCLSSIWQTDGVVQAYLEMHGRGQEYKELLPQEDAYYDSLIEVDLSSVKPMIALPFHPSNAYTIEEFLADAPAILAKTEKECTKKINTDGVEVKLSDKWYDGAFHVDQAVVAGCSGGTFENINKMAYIMSGKSVGSGALALSVYPSSQPVYLELLKNGTAAELMTAGASLRSAFCGPCFGAGDVPINNGISIRHSTRNFPNREGSKPSAGQISTVALMDAMSIAATAANGGRLIAADTIDWSGYVKKEYKFDNTVYDNRVYYGFGKAKTDTQLRFGPNIADWPAMSKLTDNLILPVVSVIRDEVTTTDELIPSGETSSYRSNPLKLAEFALSRRDPEYVGRAKQVQKYEHARRGISDGADAAAYIAANTPSGIETNVSDTGIGSVIFANKPGDGSAREQAASCQKVLGGWANVAVEYATKRYRSNLINWGMLPLQCAAEELTDLDVGDTLFLHNVREALEKNTGKIEAYLLGADKNVKQQLTLKIAALTDDERQIILDGCLINYYRR